MSDYSEKFYVRYANRYAEVAHQLLQSIYIESSHAKLAGDLDLIEQLKKLTPGKRGLDAGCGAGAHDIYNLWVDGYDIFGIDAAIVFHLEIADRLSFIDLRGTLAFPTSSFDFVICNAVIQQIEPQIIKNVTLS